MIKNTLFFIPILLVLTMMYYISCRSDRTECIAYKLQNGCDYVFDYDGKLRTYFVHDPEFANIDEFKKRFYWDVDTSFAIKNATVSSKTDSLIFVFDDYKKGTGSPIARNRGHQSCKSEMRWKKKIVIIWWFQK